MANNALSRKLKKLSEGIPLFRALPGTKELKLLATALFFTLVITLVTGFYANRGASRITEYALIATNVELFTERLSTAAKIAVTGNSEAFDDLDAARISLIENLATLDKGKGNMAATFGRPRVVLDAALINANKIDTDAMLISNGRAALVTLSRSIEAISLGDTEFRSLQEQLRNSVNHDLASTFQLSVVQIARDAAYLLGSSLSLEQLAQLGIDTYAAEAALAAMPAGDPTVQRAAELFEPYRSAVETLVGQSRRLVEAKAALVELEQGSGKLIKQSQELRTLYQASLLTKGLGIAAIVFALLTLIFLTMLIRVYFADVKHAAARERTINQTNQNAILLLMNELSDLADGDLTVKATVGEQITGAIADSVNYTAEELRKLVAGITNAALRMGQATQQADNISKDLLLAGQKQAHEIQDTEEAVQLMAKSIAEVDSSATKATRVGNQTLAASEQGALAVRNAIAGMDSIREQIQETAKRIKRLGESSQEIGEIVDLISDITEQTNVLALNAAIQAASAGEAGRGFSVVAEEVQRLAERSAEATKQIGALVKTIQSDTYDAVAAMETSTVGVVDGAKLADAAGQSLQEIQLVSKELAALINSISVTTQVQTDMVSEVSSSMRDILTITGQTTEGTRQTAVSVAQLNTLASELSASVAGFKVE
ncbi:MAG: methyl-accepting chemotaxis protein [Sideroxydans sp.]|nr:methyl-accepting chemotaxis protein [Sideroxydans sp.]